MKVAAIQSRLGDLQSAERLAKNAVNTGAEFLLFPEYFGYSKIDQRQTEEILKFLRNFSREYDVVTIGNVVLEDDGIKNRALVYKSGEVVGHQDKIHPTKAEIAMGIKKGNRLNVIEVSGVRICVLICADILYPELCRVAGIKCVDIAFNPVISFKNSELPGSNYRYCLYFARAFDNAYLVVKAGGVGKTFTGTLAAGRSLIASFDGILAKASSEDAEEVVSVDFDVNSVRKFRLLNYSLFDRNVEAYSDLLEDHYCTSEK
ncbi:MAG: carbon-nitrogen hydrolase family protein [Archaeoglobales archaeon]|nr:carbon-nitrogen hydrolase family protein [Archaeoglobales archaeon]